MLTCMVPPVTRDAPVPVEMIASAEGLLFAYRDGSVTLLDASGLHSFSVPGPPDAIGKDDLGLLMVLEDGQIGRVTGALDWTVLGEVHEPATWIGGGHGHVLLAVAVPGREGRTRGFYSSDLLVLDTGARWPIEHGVRVGLVVGEEFGGWISRVDLKRGVVEVLPNRPLGVIALPDGGVYSYGGLAHMGYLSATMDRLDAPGEQLRASSFPFSTDRSPPIEWMSTDGQRTWAGQGARIYSVEQIGGEWEQLPWRGGPVTRTAVQGGHLVLLSSTGVLADLDGQKFLYRCLDGSEPRSIRDRQ